MKYKIKKIFVSCLILIMMSASTLSLYSITAYAEAAPSTPPDVSAVRSHMKSQLKLVRGNAYTHGMEKLGYELQPGFNALSMLSAMEAVTAGTDYAFSDEDEYTEGIQAINDKSDLPDWLTEFIEPVNAEIFFYKLSYADVQLGVYLDEAGQQLGDIQVKYTKKLEDMLQSQIELIHDYWLGQPSVEGLPEEMIAKYGMSSGTLTSQISYSYVQFNGKPSYPYNGFVFKVIEAAEDAQFFCLRVNGYVNRICCITSGDAPKIRTQSLEATSLTNFQTRFERFFRDTSYSNDTMISASSDVHEFEDADGNIKRYRLYEYVGPTFMVQSLSDVEKYGFTDKVRNTYVIYPQFDMSTTELQEWFKESYEPPAQTEQPAVALKPTGIEPEPIADTAYQLNDIIKHNEYIEQIVPEMEPVLDPEAYPDEEPAYEPRSIQDTVPAVEPVTYPDPVTNPEISTEPVPEPEPAEPSDPDSGTETEEPSDSNVVVAAPKGITDRFPFCIPFDLIDAFRGLSAEPETPRWEFRFVIPSAGIDIPVVIDLSQFDNVAKLCRILLLLLFIVSLIVGTRKLISN